MSQNSAVNMEVASLALTTTDTELCLLVSQEAMQAVYLETLLQNACPCIYFKYTLEDTVYYSQQCPLYEEPQEKS